MDPITLLLFIAIVLLIAGAIGPRAARGYSGPRTDWLWLVVLLLVLWLLLGGRIV